MVNTWSVESAGQPAVDGLEESEGRTQRTAGHALDPDAVTPPEILQPRSVE